MLLDTLDAAMIWAYKAIATLYGMSIIGGILIFIAERFDRRREPSDTDVRRATARYRQYYGKYAFNAVGDHIFAASFAPDTRHKRFLKRISAELLASDVINENRAQAIEL